MLTILIVGLAVVIGAIWLLSKTKKQTPKEDSKAPQVVAKTPVVKLKPVLKKKAASEVPTKASKTAKAKPAAKAAKPVATKRAGKKL